MARIVNQIARLVSEAETVGDDPCATISKRRVAEEQHAGEVHRAPDRPAIMTGSSTAPGSRRGRRRRLRGCSRPEQA